MHQGSNQNRRLTVKMVVQLSLCHCIRGLSVCLLYLYCLSIDQKLPGINGQKRNISVLERLTNFIKLDDLWELFLDLLTKLYDIGVEKGC